MNPILLVYDNKRFAELVQFVINASGFKTVLLPDPLSLFEKAKEINPPLIIMDVFLKQMDGLYLIERLNGVKELAAIPVFVVSSRNEPLAVFDALERGAADYIAAPINEDLLLEKVKKIVELT